jgi:hypothetical protein
VVLDRRADRSLCQVDHGLREFKRFE